MRIRMSVLAAGLVAGALALGSSSAGANPQIAMNGFYANSSVSVVVNAPAAAAGQMCYIIQGGQFIGGGMLAPGMNSFSVATNGLSSTLTADGPVVMAIKTGTFDDVWGEE